MTRVLKYPLIPFVFLAAVVITVSYIVLNSAAFARQPDLLAMASTIDLTLIIPGLYFLCIRKTKIPKVTVVPVIVLSIVLASALIPGEYHQTLEIVKYLIPFIELFVMGFVIYNVRKTVKAYNRSKKLGSHPGFLETIQSATIQAFGKSPLANALATEISLFHYAILGWGKQKEYLGGERFTYHKESGYYMLLAVVAFALPAETAIFHLLLVQWSNVAAWILTGLSIYSIFFVLGDFNAIRKRPIELVEEGLKMRLGLRWNVTIPYDQIEKVELRIPDKEKEEFADFKLFGESNVVIDLSTEQEAKGLYGLKKRFTKMALNMDDKAGFKTALEQRLASGETL